MHPWLSTLHGALRTEEASQREAHAEAMKLSPTDQIAAGVRWPVLQCTEESTRRGERLLLLRLPTRGSLHEGIGPGDRVRVRHRGRRRW